MNSSESDNRVRNFSKSLSGDDQERVGAIEGALNHYLGDVEALGIVSEIIISGKMSDDFAHLWAIPKEDFSHPRGKNLDFVQLSRLGTDLANNLAGKAKLVVSLINPSELKGFLAFCSENGIKLERIPLPLPTSSGLEPGVSPLG